MKEKVIWDIRMSDIYKAIVEDGYSKVFITRPRCVLVYTEDELGGVSLTGCVPNERVSIYEVTGKLGKNDVKNKFLAENPRTARREYERIYQWKSTAVRLLSNKEVEEVLRAPLRFPVNT